MPVKGHAGSARVSAPIGERGCGYPHPPFAGKPHSGSRGLLRPWDQAMREGEPAKVESTNLAARAGRWSAAHWKTATFGWLAFVVVAIVLGMLAGTVKLTDAEQGTGETARAQKIL